MTRVSRPTTAALVGLGILALVANPVSSSATETGPDSAASAQVAHMGGGMGMTGPGFSGRGGMGPGMMGYGPGMGMGSGMMGYGPGMMDYGAGMMGYGAGMMGHGPGMMGYGRGMMGSGMMGYGAGMMGHGPGMMAYGRGMMGYGPGMGYGPTTPRRDLTTDDVRKLLQNRLDWYGNKRLKLGDVKEADKDAIVADIVTVDGSLVDRLTIDRHTGRFQRSE